ncbi:TPA: NUDIX hydrolase [Candidatus Saccharibacteria bacterium]|nr:NUDIX hydrolase [Candidatus Saccharibacteria bacterium]HIO87483.1 NUDIX hydrolase [Candidatus Saccharibacteria bacterium]
MRSIKRDIVGGFIFSSDGKLLLGKNRKGGVYQESFVVPGGGIDQGETKHRALQREMLEETGINIRGCKITPINTLHVQSQKTLRETGETVLVNMTFYNYKIVVPKSANDIKIKAEDDWTEPQWFTNDKLQSINLSPPTKTTLGILNILK